MRQRADPGWLSDLALLAARVSPLPSDSEEFAMLTSFAVAMATMIAVLASQS
jgi:hypothetical protein